MSADCGCIGGHVDSAQVGVPLSCHAQSGFCFRLCLWIFLSLGVVLVPVKEPGGKNPFSWDCLLHGFELHVLVPLLFFGGLVELSLFQWDGMPREFFFKLLFLSPG